MGIDKGYAGRVAEAATREEVEHLYETEGKALEADLGEAELLRARIEADKRRLQELTQGDSLWGMMGTPREVAANRIAVLIVEDWN